MNRNLIEDSQALLDLPSHAPAPNRRVAMQTALGVGYAVAAAPIRAQTAIKTPTEGLTEGEITLSVKIGRAHV